MFKKYKLRKKFSLLLIAVSTVAKANPLILGLAGFIVAAVLFVVAVLTPILLDSSSKINKPIISNNKPLPTQVPVIFKVSAPAIPSPSPTGGTENKYCKLSRKPRTSAAMGDPRLNYYSPLIDSLIIKEIKSSPDAPFSDVAKWQKDSSTSLTVEGSPILGAYVVNLPTPMTAVQVSYIINNMFNADAPGPDTTPPTRCRYDFIEPNWIDSPNQLDTPNDPYFKDQWNLNFEKYLNEYGANFVGAWNLINNFQTIIPDLNTNQLHLNSTVFQTLKLTPVTITVIDTGIGKGLDVLISGSMAINTKGKVSPHLNDASCDTEGCHGEKVSSIISSKTHNALGISGALGIGINYGEKNIFNTLSINVSTNESISNSRQSMAMLKATIEYDQLNFHGYVLTPISSSRVINMSYGADHECPILTQNIINTIEKQTKNGVVFVAAAGNSPSNAHVGLDSRNSPANCKSVIAVVSHGIRGHRTANFVTGKSAANPSDQAISAPGEDVLVISGNDAPTVSGTSYSAPHVSAAAALVLSINPSLTWMDVKSLLIRSSTAPNNLDRLWPALNVEQAVRFAIEERPAATKPKPKPASCLTKFKRYFAC